MKKLKKILAATDFSDNANNAFRYALWFASKRKAEICLLHILYPELEPVGAPVISAEVATDKAEAAKAKMQVLIDSNATDFNNRDMPEVEMKVEIGIPKTSISEVAQHLKADLIIMGAKGDHNPSERNIGEVTSSTIDFSDCPVLVVPENSHLFRIETAAYATDLAESDPFYIWKSGKILKPFDPLLRVVHIQQKEEENKPMEMKDLESFFKGNPPSREVSFHNMINEKVADELDEFVKDWDVDLLIMNRPDRNIIDRIFHASLTRKTAFSTKVPFLVLK